MDRAHIRAIVDAGVRAPSGDNAQPWRFESSANRIRIINVPENDTSVYNFEQQASHIAHGCAIENMRLAASGLGYATTVQLIPEGKTVAELAFTETSSPAEDLHTFIEDRHSNRRLYFPRPLDADERKVLLSSNTHSEIRVDILEGGAAKELALAASVNEQIVLENQDLHDFLFSHITWSDAEDAANPGFFVDTLELEGSQRSAFRLLKNWRLQKLLNKVGMSKKVAKENAALYASGPAIAAFSLREFDRFDLVKCGMSIERFWLTAHKLRIAAQPLAGLTLLHARLERGDRASLTEAHVGLVQEAFQRIRRHAPQAHKHIAFMLRIGDAPSARARTRRKQPDIIFS